jgi:hypothetical protein
MNWTDISAKTKENDKFINIFKKIIIDYFVCFITNKETKKYRN